MPSTATLIPFPRLDPAGALLAAAALILAADPVLWLVGTWRDPAYDSNGFLVFLAAAGLFAWSVSSPVVDPLRRRRGLALGLIASSAAVRLAGQVLAINTVGALCLVLDVYALGVLLGLGARRRPIAPAWLAVVFAFSLPLERVLQRSIGYVLQEASATGACWVLERAYGTVTCEGIRIVLAGKDVLVDLPCSGARGLLLTLLAFAAAAAVCRPAPLQAVAGVAIALASALAANVLRITILAVGIAEPWRLGGIAVMEQPWHDAIGLATLALACAPLLAWAPRAWHRQDGLPSAAHAVLAPVPRHGVPLGLGLAAFATAVVIVSLPRTPVDVAQRNLPIALPLTLAGHVLQPVALSQYENAFFTQAGGSAAKGQYGPHGLLLVRTTSPLRHLHTPDECLRGAGFHVDYLGAAFAPVPTAIYRAIAPDGARYRVDVTFISEKGDLTTNVATAVWRWLNGEARVWTAVQRISPDDLPESQHAQWTAAVIAALELRASPSLTTRRGDRE